MLNCTSFSQVTTRTTSITKWHRTDMRIGTHLVSSSSEGARQVAHFMKKKQKCLFNFQEIGLECLISKVCCTSSITAAYMPLWDLLHWAQGQPWREKPLFVCIHKSFSIKKKRKRKTRHHIKNTRGSGVSGVFSRGKLILDLWFWPKQTAVTKEAIICWLKMINSVVFLLDLLLYLSVTRPSVISFQR